MMFKITWADAIRSFAISAAFVLGVYLHPANSCEIDEAWMVVQVGEARECVNINEMPR